MKKQRILVLGAHGLIGAEIVRALRAGGHDVVGLVRSARTAARVSPGLEVRVADIATLQSAEAWRPLLAGVDAVANASGALQDGMRDNLEQVQHVAIAALIGACEEAGVRRFIQISAPGATEGATTAFLRTKAKADARLRKSALDWIIFKPGLVIARAAYGGTALIRMLAGFPLAAPVVLSRARVQTVSVDDVAEAVLAAVDGRAPMRADYDLVEDRDHALGDIVGGFRRWLGFANVRVIALPFWIGAVGARFGDVAGWLGWRSPLRSTALRVLRDDVLGDPGPWRAAAGRGCASLAEALAANPATAQERAFARVQFLLPLMIVVLSAFFIASGALALFQRAAASAIIAPRVGEAMAAALVVVAAAADILLGAAILFRPLAQRAAAMMAVLSGGYLVMSAMLAPQLWGDPLGPFVKIFPVICLALCAMMLIEER